jgi:hypothetical protein
VWISVAQSGPSMDRNADHKRTGIFQFAYAATLFACGAGDGNRTRTVSLGRVLIPPCFRVPQRYWRPQLAPGDPYRPGLMAHAWPGSRGSRISFPIEDGLDGARCLFDVFKSHADRPGASI